MPQIVDVDAAFLIRLDDQTSSPIDQIASRVCIELEGGAARMDRQGSARCEGEGGEGQCGYEKKTKGMRGKKGAATSQFCHTTQRKRYLVLYKKMTIIKNTIY